MLLIYHITRMHAYLAAHQTGMMWNEVENLIKVASRYYSVVKGFYHAMLTTFAALPLLHYLQAQQELEQVRKLILAAEKFLQRLDSISAKIFFMILIKLILFIETRIGSYYPRKRLLTMVVLVDCHVRSSKPDHATLHGTVPIDDYAQTYATLSCQVRWSSRRVFNLWRTRRKFRS